MADPRRVQLSVVAALVVVVVLLGVRALRASGAGSQAGAGVAVPALSPGGGAGADAAAPTATTSARAGVVPSAPVATATPGVALPPPTTTQRILVVHVAGAVRRPGVYDVRDGGRVVDAIRLAGGSRRGADPNALNLAAPVTDGEQVLVPRRGEPLPGVAAGGTAAAAGAVGAAGTAPAAPIDLNGATLEQLDTLQGIGPALAQAIVAYRDAHGRFTSVEDLGQVPGIGPARLETLRAAVTVG